MQRIGRVPRLVLIGATVALVMRTMGPKISDAMERKFEEASDDFPPKWMFSNITALRETTERILSILEERKS